MSARASRPARTPGLGLLLALAVGGCQRAQYRASAEEAILAARKNGLERLLAQAATGPLIPSGDITVAIDQGLVQDLLAASIPYERVIKDRYRIRITSASALFEDGAKLLRLGGRASLASRPEDQGYADVTAVGALDVMDLDHASGRLRGRVRLIAFEVHQVKLMGVDTAMEQLVEDLAREQLDTLNVLANPIEVPVRLDDRVPIPGLGPAGGIEIEAALVDLKLAVKSFDALHGKLWISIVAPARADGAQAAR